MEICQELIYNAEGFARVEENRGFRFSGAWRATAARRGFFGGVFEGSHYSGADGQNRPRFVLGFDYRLRGGFGDLIGFDVDFVIFEALGADRLKGAQADVESDFGDFDAAGPYALQDFGREVQTRGGRGHGASLPGVDGLKAFAIGGFVGALDVRRQGDVAQAVERFLESGVGGEAQDA